MDGRNAAATAVTEIGRLSHLMAREHTFRIKWMSAQQPISPSPTSFSYPHRMLMIVAFLVFTPFMLIIQRSANTLNPVISTQCLNSLWKSHVNEPCSFSLHCRDGDSVCDHAGRVLAIYLAEGGLLCPLNYGPTLSACKDGCPSGLFFALKVHSFVIASWD